MKKSLIVFWIIFSLYPLFYFSESLKLQADKNEVIGISSFILNGKGECFLFSPRLHKIFKFDRNGKYIKKYCSSGEGPGEIKRVLYMFFNSYENSLYLPEFYSGMGRVTVFDCSGSFMKIFKIALSPDEIDKIWKMEFLKDGSFYVHIIKRTGWKKYGKFYITQNENNIKYFNSKGRFVCNIIRVNLEDEISNGIGYGGPQILYVPKIIINSTPEGNMCLSKTDDNNIKIIDRKGKIKETISLDLKKKEIMDSEFEIEKDNLISFLRDDRMKYLAKNMIRLKYKPIFSNVFTTSENIILLKSLKENDNYDVIESQLLYYSWDGKKVKEFNLKGEVLNVISDKLLIKKVNDDGEEIFEIDRF